MIQIENLQKSFGKNHVLKGVDLQFTDKGGSISAILGPNGSGKTTLIKSIIGLVIPDKGTITVNGKNIKGKCEYRQQIGYLPQIARFPENLKASELIKMVKDLRKEEGDEFPLIKRFDLEKHMDKKLRNLSGGTRQKVNLVLAFMFDTPFLILDEPTSGLDPVALITLKELILEEKAKGKKILVSTHIMDFVEQLSDEVIFILEGKIYFRGPIAEILEKYDEPNLERAIAMILQGKQPVKKVELSKGKVFNIR